MNTCYLPICQRHDEVEVVAIGPARYRQVDAEAAAIEHIFNDLVDLFSDEKGVLQESAPTWMLPLTLLMHRRGDAQKIWDCLNGPDVPTEQGGLHPVRYERLLGYRIQVIEVVLL